jgi:hypothetical protein
MTYQTQQQQIDRQRALAQAIQSMNQLPQGTSYTPHGYAVPTSGFAAAAKLFGQALGGYEGAQADKSQDSLNGQRDADLQSQSSGLIDALAGPSKMGADPNTAPVGQTTSFDSSDPNAGTPQVQTDPNAPQVEQNPKRAALSAILKGAQPEDVVNMLQGPALAKFAPPKVQTLSDGQQLASTDPFNGQTTITAENVKDMKPAAPDHALVNVVDKGAPAGYRSIERQHFKEGVDQLWQPPKEWQTAQANMNDPLGLEQSFVYASQNGNKPPPQFIPRGESSGAWYHQYGKWLTAHGQDQAATSAFSAGRDADKGALKQLAKSEGPLQVASGQLDKNLDSLVASAKAAGIGENSSPIWNETYANIQKKAVGNPKYADFMAKLNAVELEMAKVQAGSTGNTAPTDASNARTHDILNESFNQKSIEAVRDALRQERDNKVKSYHETRQMYLGRLGENDIDKALGKTPATPATPNAPAATKPTTPTAATPAAAPKDYSHLWN